MSGGGSTITAPRIGGLQIQTSTYGLPIPILWGQQRLAANLLWYGDFTAIPHTTTSGGKGGGGVSQTTWSYQAAGLLGLCEGPISGIGYVWAGKDLTSLAMLGLSSNVGNYPEPVWGYLTTNHPTQAIGYSGVATVYSAKYILTDTAQLPNHSFEIKGKYQFGLTGQSGKIFTVSGSTVSSTAHGFKLSDAVRLTTTGTLPVGVASAAFSYAFWVWAGMNITLLANTDYYIINPTANTYQLAGTPNGVPIAFYSAGTGTQTATRWIQSANPKDIIVDFLTNAIYGINPSFPLDASFTNFSNYCVANGVFLSPVINNQMQASEFVKKVAEICNTGPVWSEGALKMVPYGDTSITGNGATFTPNTTPQYDLSDDDFLSDGSTDPLTIIRNATADAFNQVSIQFKDRTNQYNQGVIEAKDQSNIDLFGLRPMPPLQYEYITDADVARSVAQIVLQRVLYNRNQFSFSLPWKYARLEPMDLVTITDLAIGLDHKVVRITEIEEDENERLAVVAEEYLANNATATAYPSQGAVGFTINANIDSGISFATMVFDPAGALTTSGYELWIASAGGPNWSGAHVFVSLDNTTYKNVGSINSSARYGVLTAGFAAGADTDTTNTCAVDLSESLGVLTAGSTSDADNHQTLALVGGTEVISFSTATLTAANKYNLTTYIRRGIFNTARGAHLAGEAFVRLDDAIFKYAYDPSWVGKTIYVKLLPFNQYGASQYQLSDITALTYVIKGAIGGPNDVANFDVRQVNEVASFSWTKMLDAYVDIGYAPQGTTDWSLFTMLTEAARGTEMTNAGVPPGTWVFGAKARDKSNKLSKNITTKNFIVTTINLNIISSSEQIGWNGALVGLVEHWTGVLIPDSQHISNFYSGWEVFDQWVPDPVSYIEYTTPVIDALYDEKLRVYSTLTEALGVGQIGTPTMNKFIETWLTGAVDPNTFSPWDIGTVFMRYLRGRISAAPVQGGLFMITNYTMNVDMSPVTVSSPVDVSIGAPNSTVTSFPIQFHYLPFVVPMIKSGTGKSVTVTSITLTGCIFKIWDGQTEVSGTLAYTVTGE